MSELIGIVGAGQMGCGIAHVCAAAQHNVLLHDFDPQAAKNGLANIATNLHRQAARGNISEADVDAALARITLVDSLAGLADCNLVIEAVTEDENVKIGVFEELCKTLSPETFIATNTSSISVTRLASVTDRPEKFIGIHFMNPVPMMEVVELIRGIATDEATYQYARDLAQGLGKITTDAEDFPAFIVNRLLIPMINEAVYTLYEGVGTVEAIDTAMKLGAHHPMGPLELADFIGLDICLSIMQVLHDGLADTKYRPCPLLVKYVDAGWLGRKTGRGFYDYSGDAPVPTR